MIWRNGTIIDETVDFSRYDTGCFTTGRTVNGRIWLHNEHETRLRMACAELGIAFPAYDFTQSVYSLIEKSGLRSARFRSTIAGDSRNVDSYCLIAPLPSPRKEVMLKSVCLRDDDKDRTMKTINRIDYQYYADIVAQEKSDDVLLYDRYDNVLETSIANVFFMFGNDIITPPSELPLLPGLVREVLLQNHYDSYRMFEQHLSRAEVIAADGVFITNAVRGIEPVAYIDDHQFSTDAATTFKRIADTMIGFEKG